MSSVSTLLTVILTSSTLYAGGVSITTGQYDNYRTSANLAENTLKQANVATATFGKVGSWTVDGQVYAQPLYLSGTPIRGHSSVLYVATMHNPVYAFDADTPGGGPIWQVTLGPSVPIGMAGSCPENFATGPELGILSTPVVDPESGTLYAVYTSPTGPATYGFYM